MNEIFVLCLCQGNSQIKCKSFDVVGAHWKGKDTHLCVRHIVNQLLGEIMYVGLDNVYCNTHPLSAYRS